MIRPTVASRLLGLSKLEYIDSLNSDGWCVKLRNGPERVGFLHTFPLEVQHLIWCTLLVSAHRERFLLECSLEVLPLCMGFLHTWDAIISRRLHGKDTATS